MRESLEHRAAALEVRAKGRKLEGYAAIFGVETRIGPITESIRAGAFAGALSDGRDVLALVDHSPAALLARSKSGTLRLAQDSRGLSFELDVPDTTTGRDVLALAERGDLGGASFGFRPSAAGEIWQGKSRTLTNIDLREVSIVQAFPAYAQTTVAARSASKSVRLALSRRLLEIAEAGR
jgi:hypothetical protein